MGVHGLSYLLDPEGEDSTPVRGALYEPVVLLGVSAKPRLSQIRARVVVWGMLLERWRNAAVK